MNIKTTTKTTKLTVSELVADLVTTFKDIANFDEREYITDEIDIGQPSVDMDNLVSHFDALMDGYNTIEFFPADTPAELKNLFMVSGIKSRGLENALTDYANGVRI